MAYEQIAVISDIPTGYTSNPAMNGTASPGSSANFAKGDHVHPSDTAKQSKPTITTATMAASGWSSGVYSFESTYPFASYNISIEVASTATSAQFDAFGAAKIVGNASANTVTALGTVPTVDIPIIIEVWAK